MHQVRHVQGHMLIPAGRQLLKLCLSFGVWPGAGYLIFLSLDIFTFEVAECKGLVRGRSLAPSGLCWAQSQVQEALGKGFLPEKLHPPCMTPKLYSSTCQRTSFQQWYWVGNMSLVPECRSISKMQSHNTGL